MTQEAPTPRPAEQDAGTYLPPTPVSKPTFAMQPPVDAINPPHYRQGAVECIDAIHAAVGDEGFKDYCTGQVIKYIWRYRHKNGLEDLKKAQWYLTELIKQHGA